MSLSQNDKRADAADDLLIWNNIGPYFKNKKREAYARMMKRRDENAYLPREQSQADALASMDRFAAAVRTVDDRHDQLVVQRDGKATAV